LGRVAVQSPDDLAAGHLMRFYRSTAEAFPVERFPAVFGPYRRNTFARQLARVSAWLGAFALLGALIAWRL